MAASIEKIFQDFILSKIREIEDQMDDKAAIERVDAGSEMFGSEETTSEKDKQEKFSQKKHKKHKKHKSKKKKKKKKRNQEDDGRESSSESEAEDSYQPSGETPTEVNVEQSEDYERNSTFDKGCTTRKRKKKKKKRKRKYDESSSDSNTESVSKQRNSQCGQSLSPRRREELPDLIPKQDTRGSRDPERLEKRSCRSSSRSHSPSHSHSCTLRRKHHHKKSRTRSPPSSQGLRTRSSSSEMKGLLDESGRPIQGPSEGLQLSLPGCSLELQNLEPNQKPLENKEEKNEKAPQKLVTGSGTTHSVLNQTVATDTDQSNEPSFPPLKESPCSFTTNVKSPAKRKKQPSTSPQRKKEAKSSKSQKRLKSPSRSQKSEYRSRSSSRSRSRGWRSRRSRSRSVSRSRSRATYRQRDRWKREPSHSPVLILRKNRSPSRKRSSNSPHRISELDKEQLLEIAKANAAAMCAKAGMPIPASLRSNVLPLTLPNMATNAAKARMTAATMTAVWSNVGALSSLQPLTSVANKSPPVPTQPNTSGLEELKRKVLKQANIISIQEFTDKCKMIVDSKGELPVAMPHVSDEEDDGIPFGGSTLREQKAISFSITNTTVHPAMRCDAGMAKEFPVSSGSQHRKKEGETLSAYGEWVPVDKTDKAAATSTKALTRAPTLIATSTSGEAVTATHLPNVVSQPAFVPDSVFPDPRLQPVDITQAVTERMEAQRRLAKNPYDVSAICMLNRAQEQVDAWAHSSSVPGLFTGSTGAHVLSSEELSTSGPQAWLKKDQFLRAAPVSGGVGEFLMRKMGWKTGEGLGRNREGTVEPIIIDFKVDRKGLVAEGEKPQKQTGGLVVTKDLMGKHPVSALIELCNRRRIMQPDFVMVHHSGPDHRKNFIFKVTVNGVDYQPQTASPNKKHAKAMAATVALQALGEVPADGPGLYTGPVFTTASTGPLFST